MAAQTTDVLQQLLGKVDSDAEAKILRIVNAYGMSRTDPLFLLLLANSSVQVLIEQAPGQLQQTMEYANQKVLDNIEQYEKAARRGVEREVAEAAKLAIEKAGASKAQVTARSMVSAGAIALGFLVAGVLGGLGFSQWKQATTELAPGGPVQLTLEQAEALSWAISEEGQYARQIMSWNEDLLGGECQGQVEGLGITIQMGTRQAKSGFCLLWTQPPGKREFVSAN